MKLDLLFKREKFIDIFNSTVTSYLKKKFGWEGKIYWSRNCFIKNTFLINKHLNIIYKDKISFKNLKNICNEHFYDRNIFKYLLRVIYIFLSSLKLFRRLLSSYSIKFTNSIDCFDDFVFIGGNNNIKILDQKKNRCIVLTKDGFSKVFFKNTLYVRTKYAELINPNIIDFNLNEGWYEEKLIESIPIDRQKKGRFYEEGLLFSKQKMKKIYEKSKKNHLYNYYINQLKKEIKSEINSLNANYKELFKSKLSNIINSIIDKLCKINNKNSLITVSLTHGDFHEGNILYNEKKGEIILIDWEYSSIRCIWYDAFFNELKCSSPKGLAKRIKLFENKSYGEELFWFLDGIKLDLELSQKTFLYIFILELLLSRLQQSNISKELIINQGLILYVQELSKLNFVNA